MAPLPSVKETFARHHLKAMTADAPGFLLETMQRVGPDFRLGVGATTMTVLSSPEALRHVLQQRASAWGRGSTLADTRLLLGNGLIASDPPLWLRQRRTMQPAFHHAHSTRWLEVILSATDRCLATLPAGAPFSVRQAMLRLTRETIVETLFSDSLADQAEPIADAFAVIEQVMGERSVSLAKLPLDTPTPQHERFRAAIAFLDEHLFSLIAKRRAQVDPPTDLLTLLLRATDPETGHGMSDQQLRDELMSTFLAGHETTANVLTWAVALLGQHPKQAALVKAELEQVLGSGAPTLESFGQLPRLTAIIRETLRLYPPVWMLAREALEDDEVLSVRMPRGSVVLLTSFLTHRSPSLWREPSTFDPDRFLTETSTDAAAWGFRYLPFGAGPHVCIGNRLALLECLVVLARWLQHGALELDAPDSIRHAVGISLMVADGLPARWR